jgi:glycosyltransferase involved in cell wall biosynthesis
MKTLVVEGWRTSCHSYALINQRQLLHLLNDSRLTVSHRDVPFFRDEWAKVDSGLPEREQSSLAAIAEPPAGLQADVTYRISYPFRVHAGSGRVFVFATNELDRTLPDDCVGPDGRPETADPAAVEIVTPSTWSHRAFVQAGYAPGRVHVLPHGVDPALATPIAAAERRRLRQQLRLPEDAFAFLNVGAMSWNKGVGPLIAAFAVHRRSYPRSVLILKGGNALYGDVFRISCEEAARLRPEARDPAVLQNLRYIRVNLPLHAVARLYRTCDAYISTYRAEGFNLPVLEAMASDLPVIVTRGGSTEDFCPDDGCLKVAADPARGRSGAYLEPRIDSIVEQMGRMVEDAGAREHRSQLARDYALPRYSWARVTGQLTDLLLGA